MSDSRIAAYAKERVFIAKNCRTDSGRGGAAGFTRVIMNRKNVTFGKKVMIGIGGVLALLLLVAVWPLGGITRIVRE